MMSDSMRYTERFPAVALRRFVDAFWTLSSGDAPAPAEAGTILPDGMMEIVVVIRGAITVPPAGRPHHRLLLGPSDRARRLRYDGAIEIAGVRLRPGAATTLLTASLAYLSDRIVPLAEAAPELDRRVSRSIATPCSARAAMSTLERITLEATQSAPPPNPLLERAVAEIRRRRGRVSIDGLAAQLGVSRRTLERRFLSDVGLTPKRWCRVARFQAALAAMEARGERGWADFAQHLGYADQAHFSREFSEFTGVPPSAAWWGNR
jgi:AraC-like DNA-binding protein